MLADTDKRGIFGGVSGWQIRIFSLQRLPISEISFQLVTYEFDC